jgi:hypothetical protein
MGLSSNDDTASLTFITNSVAKTWLTAAGNFGIGTYAPDKKLEVNLGTSDALRLTYNDDSGSAAFYTDFTVSSAGNLSISPNGGRTTINGNVVATSPVILPSYTVAGLPSAATHAQGLAYVSNGTSNKRLAVSDGTNWRFPDGAIVS